jgi:hypothetical protein
VDHFFKQFFVDSMAMKAALDKCQQMFFNAQPEPIPQAELMAGGWPVFPGGYLLGSVLLVNLLFAYYSRFALSWKKAGIIMIHSGIIILLLGQVLTDQLAIESYIAMEAGDRRNYSESHDENELVIIAPLKNGGGTNQVVSIPEWMLEKQKTISHPALDGVKLRAVQYWRNAELVKDLPGVLRSFVNTFADNSNQHELARKNEQIFLRFISEARIPEDLKAWRDFAKKLARMDEVVLGLPEKFKKDFGAFIGGFRQHLNGVREHKAKDGRVAENYRWVIVRKVDFGMDARNLPVVVVEILGPDGKPQGSRLVSPFLREQTVELNGKTCQLALRGKRFYHNYSLTLLDLKWEKYPGTETPKNYESIVLVQPRDGEAYVSNIYMNHPLRMDGKTHYQHQLGAKAAQSRSLYTQLAVVQNPSWLTPYLGCLVVATGMLWQFLGHLIGFVSKRRTS